jgi:hypothetical protein
LGKTGITETKKIGKRNQVLEKGKYLFSPNQKVGNLSWIN